MYKLYVEVEGMFQYITSDDYISNIQKFMKYEEENIRKQFKLGLVHYLVFELDRLIIDCWRYEGVDI